MKTWDQPFSIESLREALRHRAVDRNCDTWLVLMNGRVVEGHPGRYRAEGACQILNDHAASNNQPREYSYCHVDLKLYNEVARGAYDLTTS